MAIEQPVQAGQIEFKYPRQTWLFTVACYLILLVFFIAFSFGKIPRQFLWPYFGAIAFYLYIVSIFLWGDCLDRLLGAGKSIIVGIDGIRVGKKFAAWDKIEEIRPGVWFVRAGRILIKLKRKKVPFFKFTLKSEPKFLGIPAYPFVYRELIPAIHTLRPDLPISPLVIRYMADPEGSIAPRRWLLAPALVINIILLVFLLLPEFQSLIASLIISMALLLIGPHMESFAFKLVISERDKFIKFAVHSVIIVFFAVWLKFFNVEPLLFTMLITAIITASVMGLVALFAVREMTEVLKVVVLCLLVGLPMATYFYEKSIEWPAKAISSCLSADENFYQFWSSSGKYVTDAWYEGEGCVIDANNLERKFVPEHNGKIQTIWLDERFLIRRVTVDDADGNDFIRELWIYDFSRQKEFQVPTPKRFSIGMLRPVDYTNRYVTWIDFKPDIQKLRFWNLETMKEDMEARELPKDVNWAGGQAVWTGQKELGVYVERAETDCREKRLYVLQINLETGGQKLLSSAEKYERWYPVNDLKYAFGVNRPDYRKYSADFVDLETNQSKPISGRDFPLAALQARCAYHVTQESAGTYLMRFDYDTGRDERVCRVPKRMIVEGVSSTGRFVITGFDDFSRFPVYMVVDVVNGRRHWIHLPGMISAGSPELTAFMPATSPFSPDEHRIILEAIGMGDFRTFLLEIPEKW